MDKQINFSVPRKKHKSKQITKNGEEIAKTISCKLKFIDSSKFIENSLSNFVDNLAERIRKIKCKSRHGDKNCEEWGIKYKDCKCYLINMIY